MADDPSWDSKDQIFSDLYNVVGGGKTAADQLRTM